MLFPVNIACILVPIIVLSIIVILTVISLLVRYLWHLIRPRPPRHECRRCGMLIEGQQCPVCGKPQALSLSEILLSLLIFFAVMLLIGIVAIALILIFFLSSSFSAPSPQP